MRIKLIPHVLNIILFQDNLDKLDEECRNTVNDYTRLEAKNTRLNTAVAVACRDIIEDECKGEEDVSLKI